MPNLVGAARSVGETQQPRRRSPGATDDRINC
jgi:hypothetical protein